jgi:RimJ/RimL family protein N-acetyltransferase
MRHDIRLDCVRCRLRPVTLEDAPFIVALRTNPHLNRFIHESSEVVEDQVAWLEDYFGRLGDYCFIVEDVDSGESRGTIGLYNVVSDSSEAEWGRWIIQPLSMAALESAWLIYEVGFSLLRLERLYCRSIVQNTASVSFHDTFGALRTTLLEGYFSVRGERQTAVEYSLAASDWPMLRARHYSTISRLASATLR